MKRSSVKILSVTLFVVFLWGGLTARLSFADNNTLSAKGYTLTNLGNLGGVTIWVNAINNRGQVVGGSSIGDVGSHAFLYTNGKMTDLGTLGGTHSGIEEININNRGQVVGTSDLVGDAERHAFLYSDGKMTDLGTL